MYLENKQEKDKENIYLLIKIIDVNYHKPIPDAADPIVSVAMDAASPALPIISRAASLGFSFPIPNPLLYHYNILIKNLSEHKR
jgi:hypothetical protein